MKKKYSQEFSKLKKNFTEIQKRAEKLESAKDQSINEIGEPISSKTESSNELKSINEKINEKLHYMRHASDTFPRPNGFVFKNF